MIIGGSYSSGIGIQSLRQRQSKNCNGCRVLWQNVLCLPGMSAVYNFIKCV